MTDEQLADAVLKIMQDHPPILLGVLSFHLDKKGITAVDPYSRSSWDDQCAMLYRVMDILIKQGSVGIVEVKVPRTSTIYFLTVRTSLPTNFVQPG